MKHAWTIEDDALVAAMIAEGQSGSDIARVMGMSRQAIAGRVFRNQKAGKQGFGHGLQKPQALPPASVLLFDTPAPRNRLRFHPLKELLDLGHHDCRYPVEHNPEAIGLYLFCARMTATGEDYCAKHNRICRGDKARYPVQGKA